MQTFNPTVGQFVVETLVTDTIGYQVVGVTAKTIKIQRTAHGEPVKAENRDGNPYPCVYTEMLTWPEGATYTLRLRKDGTYRMGQGASPLRPAPMVDGKPVTFTDYRF